MIAKITVNNKQMELNTVMNEMSARKIPKPQQFTSNDGHRA